jgi:ketosteroid isomerase-like protein
MKTKFILAGCLALLLFTIGFPASAADTTIEQTLRALDAQWSAAAAAKDLDKTVSYYSDDAMVLPPNMASATTKEAIRDVWKDMIASASSVSWKATKVEVAKSGDMAYVSGTYEVALKDASGKPVNDRGKYLEVWEKQANGEWKCGADTWNSDLPASAPPEKK